MQDVVGGFRHWGCEEKGNGQSVRGPTTIYPLGVDWPRWNTHCLVSHFSTRGFGPYQSEEITIISMVLPGIYTRLIKQNEPVNGLCSSVILLRAFIKY